MVVLLAGGFGTRISEESHLKPKPMVEIYIQFIMVRQVIVYVAENVRRSVLSIFQ